MKPRADRSSRSGKTGCGRGPALPVFNWGPIANRFLATLSMSSQRINIVSVRVVQSWTFVNVSAAPGIAVDSFQIQIPSTPPRCWNRWWTYNQCCESLFRGWATTAVILEHADRSVETGNVHLSSHNAIVAAAERDELRHEYVPSHHQNHQGEERFE